MHKALFIWILCLVLITPYSVVMASSSENIDMAGMKSYGAAGGGSSKGASGSSAPVTPAPAPTPTNTTTNTATNTSSDSLTVNIMCTAINEMTGNVGKAIASLIMISLAISLFLGKVNWGMAISVAVAIGILFGAKDVVVILSGGGKICV